MNQNLDQNLQSMKYQELLIELKKINKKYFYLNILNQGRKKIKIKYFTGHSRQYSQNITK